MRAARYHGRMDLRVEEIDPPEPGLGEVQIRVAFCGLCGSDVHEYYGGPTNIPVEPHLLTGHSIPMAIGHEFSGTVTAVGAGVTSPEVGDLIAVEPVYRCGACPACRTGATNLCRSFAVHGMQAAGGLAEYTVIPSYMAHVVPPGVTAEQAALAEPLAVCYRAAQRSGARPGDRVVILGAGPIGIGVLLTLRAFGVTDVRVVEVSDVRRAVAERLGAIVLDPAAEDTVAAVDAWTDGLGAEVVIDCAGTEETLLTAGQIVTAGGEIVAVAIYRPDLRMHPMAALGREARLTRVRLYTREDFDGALALMARGAIDTAEWVSRCGLHEAAEALGTLRGGTAMKVLVSL